MFSSCSFFFLFDLQMDLTYGTISDPKLKISIKLEGIVLYVSSYTIYSIMFFFFVEVDHEIFSMTILSLPQI